MGSKELKRAYLKDEEVVENDDFEEENHSPRNRFPSLIAMIVVLSTVVFVGVNIIEILNDSLSVVDYNKSTSSLQSIVQLDMLTGIFLAIVFLIIPVIFALFFSKRVFLLYDEDDEDDEEGDY